MPYKSLFVIGRNKNNTAAMGSSQLPIACAGGMSAYTMRFDLKPEAIIHDLRVFRKLYILCVVERTLCRAFTGHGPKGLGYPESDGRCDALRRLLRLLVQRVCDSL